MGVCAYCGQKAGWLKNTREECVQKAARGVESLKQVIADGVLNGQRFADIQPTLVTLRKQYLVPDEEAVAAIKNGWDTAAKARSIKTDDPFALGDTPKLVRPPHLNPRITAQRGCSAFTPNRPKLGMSPTYTAGRFPPLLPLLLRACWHSVEYTPHLCFWTALIDILSTSGGSTNGGGSPDEGGPGFRGSNRKRILAMRSRSKISGVSLAHSAAGDSIRAERKLN